MREVNFQVLTHFCYLIFWFFLFAFGLMTGRSAAPRLRRTIEMLRTPVIGRGRAGFVLRGARTVADANVAAAFEREGYANQSHRRP